MKTINLQSLKQILVLILLIPALLGGQAVHAALSDFSLTARNFVQVDDRTFEFDLYLLDTDPGQPFQLASVQCGLTVNTAIFAGGSLSVTPVAGTSALATLQVPQHATFVSGGGADVIRLAGENPPGNGNGTVISTVAPGTRIIRLRAVSTVPFPKGSLANLAFLSGTAVAPFYATRVAAYQAGTNVQLDVTTGVNAVVAENPALNAGFPTAYNVTGGGSCCPSAAGLGIGLSGSQAGVSYTLLNNGVPAGTPVNGNGSALTFPGLYPSGHYTVSATNASGTVAMPNAVDVLYYPAPVPTVSSNSPLCAGATLNLSGGPAGLPAYAWTGPNGFTSALSSPALTGATVAATGTYTLTVSNSYGCSVSASTAVTVNPLPVPVITGPVAVCTGTTGVPYTTDASKTNYSWSVTGGWIAAGAGSSSVLVNWGNAGAGNVSVSYTGGGCAAAVPTVLNVSVNVPPVVSRSVGNVTVANGQTSCSDAQQTLTVAGGGTSWVVNSGGNAYLVAGVNILLEPGAKVLSGGHLHAYIANDCAYCNAPKNSAPIGGVEEEIQPSPEAQTVAIEPGDILLYPNPARDRITIDFSRVTSTGETARVMIFDLQGRILRQVEIPAAGKPSVDLSGLSGGLFPVRITAGNSSWIKKIIITD